MSLIRAIYNRFPRSYLPYKISVHNGVPVRSAVRLFDWTDEFPRYEESLVQSIRETVRYDDTVTVVGGGLGVSTVVAGQRTVVPNSVTTYEGSLRQAEIVRETISLNRLSQQCSIRHAIVGENVGVYGQTGSAEHVEPADLPECEVLILDCEGSETGIIDSLVVEPRTIVVETHEFLGVSEEDVRESLTGQGYAVTERRVEDQEDGVFILVATRGD